MLYCKRIEEKMLFGKVIKVRIEYFSDDNAYTGAIHEENFSVYIMEVDFSQADIPDGHHSYYEWNDEPSIFWLSIAMLALQENAIMVPAYGWVFWDCSLGFYGPGYEYFQNI